MSQTGMEDNLYTADQFIEIFGGVIADALKKLDHLTPAKKTQKWIPVSDHLPEYAKFYLTSTEDDSVYCDFYDGYRFLRTEKIIAWMKMPEPYTEEEQ